MSEEKAIEQHKPTWPLKPYMVDLLRYLHLEHQQVQNAKVAEFKADIALLPGYEDMPKDAVCDLGIMAFRKP